MIPTCYYLLCVRDLVKCTKVCTSVYYRKTFFLRNTENYKMFAVHRPVFHTETYHIMWSLGVCLSHFSTFTLSHTLSPSLILLSSSILPRWYLVFVLRSLLAIVSFEIPRVQCRLSHILLKFSGVKLKSFQLCEVEFRRKYCRC